MVYPHPLNVLEDVNRIHGRIASIPSQIDCFSGAVRKNAVHASALENWSMALRGTSAAGARWLFLLTFFFFFYTIIHGLLYLSIGVHE